MSLRLNKHEFAVTASGTWFQDLSVNDFIIIPFQPDTSDVSDAPDTPGMPGTAAVSRAQTSLERPAGALAQNIRTHEDAVEAEYTHRERRPSSEWRMHHRSYLTRPDAKCIIHLHPQNATVLASADREIRLITLDHAYYVGNIETVEFAHNASVKLADTVAAAHRHCNSVILRHHGCSVMAETVEMAYRRILNLEDAAKATLLLESIGDTHTCFPAEALKQLKHV